MRDHALLGPASKSTDQPICRKAGSDSDPHQSFQSSDSMRPHFELSAIPKGRTDEPGKCRCVADQGIDQRTAGHEVAERDEHSRTDRCVVL
nr:hypothetical protein CFP56_70970 [Quercus suber]